MTESRKDLLEWQWSAYPDAHQNRRNLWLHVFTVPLFMAGTIALITSPFTGAVAAVAGIAGMAIAMGAQGKGHAGESERPAPFRGPVDVAARIFAEQWVTFPRFVLTGGLRRALRGA